MRKLEHRKLLWIIISIFIALSIAIGVWIIIDMTSNESLIEMQIVYVDNPAFYLKDMKLIWDDTVYHVTHIENARPGKEIGYAPDEYSNWRIYELRGYGREYLYATENDDVWRVMSKYPPEQPYRQYILDNATDNDRLTKLLSISLYENDIALLATPLISSYRLPACTYLFKDDELLILASIETEELENMLGIKNGDIIASFKVVDNNRIIFINSTVPVFADEGAQYYSAKNLAG